MSRAFTKEDDAGDSLPERPVPEGPNYVTPRGLEQLKAEARALIERRAAARAAGAEVLAMDRDLRYLEARINGAILVPRGSGDEVRFGARVTVEDEGGVRTVFRIVGDDEARTDPALLSWSSPLALAMMGAKAGETIAWEGPEATVRTRIVAVEY